MDQNQNARPGEEVVLLPVQDNNNAEPLPQKYLTREDLILLDQTEPFWRRLRCFLLVLFWVIWFLLLVVVILLIVIPSKCPEKPKLEFWQSKVGYYLDPIAFKDSNKDGYGDLRGLARKLRYIRDDVGAGFVLLTQIWKNQYSPDISKPAIDFEQIDATIGTNEDLENLIKSYHKGSMEVILSFDLPVGDQCQIIPTSDEKVKTAIQNWLKLGIDGVLLSASCTTGFHRVLMVESDNESLLGNETDPAAHLLVTSEYSGSIDTFNIKDKHALATSSHKVRKYDRLTLAATLLLPGTPVIYYGSEIAIPAHGSSFTNSDNTIIKQFKKMFTTSPESHIPMPWDKTGNEFSENQTTKDAFAEYLEDYPIKETVMENMAIGRPTPSILSMVRYLTQLRKEPSLLYGEYQKLELGTGVQSFKRTATGFSPIIVLLVNDEFSQAFDFSKRCDGSVKSIYTFPNKETFDNIPTPYEGSIMIENKAGEQTVYVIQCS